MFILSYDVYDVGRNEIRTHEKIVFKTTPLDHSGIRVNTNRDPIFYIYKKIKKQKKFPAEGFEPSSIAPKTTALPLSYAEC